MQEKSKFLFPQLLANTNVILTLSFPYYFYHRDELAQPGNLLTN